MNIGMHVAKRLPGRPGRARVEWISPCLVLAAGCLIGACLPAGSGGALDDVRRAMGEGQRSVLVAAWSVVATLAACVLLFAQRRRRMRAEHAGGGPAQPGPHAARSELALAAADLGLWDWHLLSGRRTLDERGAAMLGTVPGDQGTIATFYALVHPDDVVAVRQALAAHLRGDTPGYDAQFRMQHARDGWVWVHCRGRIVERDAGGAPLRIMGTRMPVSGREAGEPTVHRLAHDDALTMLPNRRLLLQGLAHALQGSAARRRHGAVLVLELDRFKWLNATLGHDMGDSLLRSVAARLRTVVRDGVTVARLGGGGFAVLLHDVGACRSKACVAADAMGRRILGLLEQPHTLDGRALRCTARMGATLFSGCGRSAETILGQADLALRQAEADGRAAPRFFDPAMQRRFVDAATMEQDLRTAWDGRQFVVHYQPIVDATGRRRGVEALLRWNHPRRGAVPPDAFIGLAEKTGLILPLGHWVLEQACALLVQWAAEASTACQTVAVNVSVRQFRQPDFVAAVMSVLRRTGAPPGRLKLELTESMLLEDLDAVRCKMQELRSCGIAFSLDDFGTGYSSFRYLKKLPLAQLKIDRSFVQDLPLDADDAAIARTIIALARSLALEVVAEGVETREQFEFLKAGGCTLFQGYLFGRPAPIQAGKAAPAAS